MQIKDIRKSKLLRQKEVASKLGIDEAYYCNIENGRYLPSSKIIKKLARVLKMPAEALYKVLQENLKINKGV